MENNRHLIISDIHGCLKELKEVLERVKYDPEMDMLIFLGDYIDRGPESAGVIDHILELKKKSKHIICLLGNHEMMFLDFLKEENMGLFLINGGVDTMQSYGSIDKIPQTHRDFLRALLPYYETTNYIFVHAGLRDGIPLKEQSLHDLVWIRADFIHSEYDHGKRVVFGHTPHAQPLIIGSKIGIDTGVVFGGCLTCWEINNA